MSDVKTVKVDNWGSFFLQKLQNFFNKTDYCDLTLQFRDNSQLKVHRLVLSACTDYFNILETTTDCTDDILLMPRDLQADVVVPIVNFMYTGTLEFEVRMYERLLKTARDMKMSVLLKLLEAHRRAMPQRPEPVILNRAATSRPAMRGGGYVPPSTRGRGRPSSYSRYIGPGSNHNTSVDEGDDVANSSSDFERLRRTGVENPSGKRPLSVPMRSTSPPQKKPNLQDVKEYTEAARLRKQLLETGDEDVVTGEYEMDDNYSQSSGEEAAATPRQSMSLLANNNSGKKAAEDTKTELTTATVTLQELPGQKMDHAKIISEVMKKYPHLLKNNKNIKLKITQKTPGASGTSFTVRAEAATPTAATTTTTTSPAAATASKPNPSATLARALVASKQQQFPGRRPGRPPLVAQQGRSLVAQKPVVTETAAAAPVAAPTPPAKGNRIDSRTMHKLIAMGAENMEGPWLCLRCGVDGKPIGIPTYRAFRKHLINTHSEKIDARLCEHCGHRSKNRQDLYHHIQSKHQILPPQGIVFPVCKTCKFVAFDRKALDEHEAGHKKEAAEAAAANSSVTRSKAVVAKKEPAKDLDEFSCEMCDRSFMTRKALSMHRIAKHRRTRRIKGGDTDEEDTEEEEESEQEVDFDSALQDDVDYVPNQAVEVAAKKVKVLSNVVTVKGKTRSSEAESLTTVATGIATSLRLGEDSGADHSVEMEYQEGEEEEEEIVDDTQYIEEALASVHGVKQGAAATAETKFLAEDGSELELTAAEKAELISQLDTSEQDKSGAAVAEDVVMMYEQGDEVVEEEDQTAVATEEEGDGVVAGSVTEPEAVLKDGDEVLMVYGGPRSAAEATSIKSEDEVEVLKEEQPSMEVEEEEDIVDEEKVENEKNKLIKELEGDWDDDAEDNEPETTKTKAETVKESSNGGAKQKVKVETETPDVSLKEEEEVSELEESPSKITGEAIKADGVEKKAPEATLAEFMNDWEDE